MKRRNLAAVTAALSTMALVPAAALAAGSDDDRSVTLHNSGTAITSDSGDRVVLHAAAPQGRQVSATLQLPMRDQARARQLIARGVTMTPAQYRAAFTPTQAKIDRAAAWARGKGLTVTGTSRDTGTVEVSSTVRTMNRAFGVNLHDASLNGRRGMAVDRDPKVPASLGLSGVAGLNTLHRVQSNSSRLLEKVPSPGKRTHATAAAADSCAPYWGSVLKPTAKKWAQESNVLCGYQPKDLATMYGAKGAAAKAPALGILLWGGDTAMKTITNQYMTKTGYPQLTSYTATIAKPDANMPACDPEGVKGEHALDVQSSHAIAPSAPIFYYGASSCYDGALTKMLGTMVSEHKVSTISMSFGSTSDAGMTASDKSAWDRPFQQAALTGISVFASTGDIGNNSTVNDGAKGVGHPASSINVTAVGGTSVGMTSAGTKSVVAGWESRFYQQPSLSSTTGITDVTAANGVEGAGGGVSQSYAQPSWQKGVVSGSTTMRTVPDVSALADPATGYTIRFTENVTVSYGSFGGTSLSSPVTAALVGLSKAQTGRKIGLATPWIYKLRGTSALSDVNAPGKAGVYLPGAGRPFNLIGFDAKPEDLVTKAGWDNVTGVGTPSGSAFLSELGK
ncbi:S53 family peptidase [Luteipulveratus sp. YIM 133132]|uniref:S53 family peptidase n=1 Tax=Luteipulveratus flavus TaxID=3031728 RepID=A0ABT6CBJ3_9MICO|nr:MULTISPECIES: S53 family peptidase [unclassified Luteipulveratus]MDE9364597.1 S53 family peptidase [Luteipulveratus sp. YIM 133132]MDF8265742.1 S53 family peptidase [Luteipulveratus sp. YIM 133296]